MTTDTTFLVKAAIRAAVAGPQPYEGPMDFPLGLLEPPGGEASHGWRDTSFPTENIDLVPAVDQVENQGSLNDCTGEAATTIVEVGLRRAGVECPELSAFFPYLQSLLATAAALRVPPADVGTSAAQVLNLARRTGFATEAVFPSPGVFSPEPPSEVVLADGATRLVVRFERLGKGTLTTQRSVRDDIIVCMRYRIPFLFCIPIAASFFTLSGPLESHPAQWERTYMGAPNEAGRHAMAAVGLGTWGGCEAVLAQNSYGPGYADGGFVAIPLSAVTGSGFDLLAIRSINGVSFGEIPLDAYRWTRDTVLADGRRVFVGVDGAPAELYRMYQAAFCRTPDAGGLGYWIDVAAAGAAMHDIAVGFVTSPEFGQLYGTSLGNRDFVLQLYRNILHREGEQGGVDFWTGHLDAGHIDRAGVLVEFAQAAENRAQTDPIIALGVVYGQTTA